MPIKLLFLDPANELKLRSKCESVLNHEHFRAKLPPDSAICIFDNVDYRQTFIGLPSLGKNFCGFFRALHEPGSDSEYWPSEILQYVRNAEGFLYEVMIYLRQRTCQSEVGTVITFAHELQHFMQYGFSRKVWMASRHVKVVSDENREKSPPWSFPHEYECQRVSKMVAETILDETTTRDYAKKQIRLGNDPEKWEFFLRLNTGEPFDFLQRTIPWVDRYRGVLREQFPPRTNMDVDFSKERWWENSPLE